MPGRGACLRVAEYSVGIARQIGGRVRNEGLTHRGGPFSPCSRLSGTVASLVSRCKRSRAFTQEAGMDAGQDGDEGGAGGSSKPTTAPPPLRFAAHTVPPWRSTACWTIASPSPEPDCVRASTDR